MLSNIYPNATGRESIYVTNGSIDEILGAQQFASVTADIEKGVDVIMALIDSNNMTPTSIMDYAYRPNNTKANIFDIYSPTVNYYEACTNFNRALEKFGNKFIIMDLNGDPYSDDVRMLSDVADVILYVFEPNKKSAVAARAYLDSLTVEERLKVKLVCNQWDLNGMKKTSIQDVVKVRSNSILWVPYLRHIKQGMFENRLCLINKLVLRGENECLVLRQAMYDILVYLLNSGSIKTIKEVSKWDF